MKVLVVAAHPDDEVLGCGGTVARLGREGHEIYTAILGEGNTARCRHREDADPRLINDLHLRCHEAARTLGARPPIMYDLPDNRFDSIAILDIIKIVEDLVTKLAPEVIYTHHGGDLNIDHGITHRAVLTATRPILGQPVRDIYAFEIASSTEWAFQSFAPMFRPGRFVEISKTLEAKVQALNCYESEIRVFPHPRSPEAIRAIARRWGSTVGCEMAEAFEVVRVIRLENGR
jgi:LmbE family N-acetylglucosaminyl deacetylase